MGQSLMPILDSSARRSVTGRASRKQPSGAGLASVLRLSALELASTARHSAIMPPSMARPSATWPASMAPFSKVALRLSRGPTQMVKDNPENSLNQRHRRLWEHRGSGPDRFQSISFPNARFNRANFSGRTFEDVVDFSNGRFFKPPIFHNVTNVVQIDFSGTCVGFALPGKRPWTFDSKIPIGLRALRKIAEETKNHDLERDLYIEERKAARRRNNRRRAARAPGHISLFHRPLRKTGRPEPPTL